MEGTLSYNAFQFANRENLWIKSAAQPTVIVIANQNRFAQKVVMLWLDWWNFEGRINHFELSQNGPANASALYSEQLDRACAALTLM